MGQYGGGVLGGNVEEHQASKSYVFELDENGDVRQDRLGI